MRLAKKTAIVTGSTRGIGEGIARAFYKEGANVVVSGRDEAAGRAIVEELISQPSDQSAQRAIFIKADVSKREDIEALKDETLGRFGSIEILVNNAGFNAPFPMKEVPLSAWDKIMECGCQRRFARFPDYWGRDD